MADLEETLVNSSPEQVGGAIRQTIDAAGLNQPAQAQVTHSGIPQAPPGGGSSVFLPVVGGQGPRVPQEGLGGTGPAVAPPGQQQAPAQQPQAPQEPALPGQEPLPGQPQMSEMEMQARQDAEGAQAGLGILGKLFSWGSNASQAAKAGKWSKEAQEVEKFIRQNPHVSMTGDRLMAIKKTLTKKQWERMEERLRVPKPNGARTTVDDVATTYAQSLLLGVGANERNLTANLFRIAEIFPMAVVEGLTGRVQMAFGDKTVHHIPSEAGWAMADVGEATRKSLRAFSKARDEVKASRAAMAPGATPTSITPGERQFRNVFQASDNVWVQKWGHMWAKGTEGLFYADEMAKAFIREVETERAARRWAYFMSDNTKDRAKLYQDLKSNPPPFITNDVERHAHQGTMTQALMSTDAVQAFLESYPLAKFAVPFVTAPTNFATQTFQRTPLLNFISVENARMLQRGGTERDEALARYGMGAALALAVLPLIQGGYITGSGKSFHPMYRKALEEAGWRPMSIYLGEDIGYVGAKELGPYFNGFATLADLHEVQDLMADEDYLGVASHVVWAFGHLATSVPFLEATGSFFEMVSTGKRADSAHDAASAVTNTVVGLFVPAGLQEAARAAQSGRMMRGPQGGDSDAGQIMKELEGLWEEASARVGWADEAELDRGPFGDIILNYNPYMPVKRTAVNKRKLDVVRKMEKIVPMGMFAITSYVGASGDPAPSGQPGMRRPEAGYTFTKAEKSYMLRLRGETVLDGKTFFEAVEEYVMGSEWDAAKGDGAKSERAEAVRKIVKRYTKEAERLFNEERVNQGRPTTKEQKKDYKSRVKKRARGEE